MGCRSEAGPDRRSRALEISPSGSSTLYGAGAMLSSFGAVNHPTPSGLVLCRVEDGGSRWQSASSESEARVRGR